jgi:hypothetical protein
VINLRWSRFPESDIVSYKLWRAIIGFEAPMVNVIGKTLQLKLNGNSLQTITFSTSDNVADINLVLNGGKAYLSQGGTHFIVRSDLRIAPGSIEIVGGTALTDLGLTAKLITEKSDGVHIASVVANPVLTTVEQYVDNDGILDDYYAISSINSLSVESLKTPWAQPINTAGPICVLEGVICNLQGVRIPDVQIIATLQTPPKDLSLAYITKTPITVISGIDGRFSLPLLQSALVKLEIPAIGYTRMVTVPDQSYIFIKDLLVDEDYTYPLGYR